MIMTYCIIKIIVAPMLYIFEYENCYLLIVSMFLIY